MKKKLFLGFTALAITGASLGAVAHANTKDVLYGHQDIVQKIAQKFNLKEEDVKAVFEEEHKAMETKMKAEMEQNLAQAVKDGKITEQQKTAILEKFGKPIVKKFDREQFKSMTEDQRKQQMGQHKADLENWAKENGLNLDLIHSIIGPGNHKFVIKMHR